MSRKIALLGASLLAVRAGADGPLTQISDVIVPEIFTPSVQLITTEKSRIIQSGAMTVDSQLSAMLSGAGETFTVPHFKDLDNDEENISGDDPDDSYLIGTSAVSSTSKNSTPKKIGTGKEVSVRLSRNQSWSSADLTAALTDKDPMGVIAGRVGAYWSRRLQAAVIATMTGIFAMNHLATGTNGSTHEKDDMTHDISGSGSTSKTTQFSAGAFLDTLVTMGDEQESLGMVLVHSIVYNRMQKQNLIDFIPDATGKVMIPTYLGRTVIVDDGMPHVGGVFETWIFGAGAIRFGANSPKVPTETERKPGSGNGGGSEILYNRLEWMIHVNGHQWKGTAPDKGGPKNGKIDGTAAANTLAHSGSWIRSFNERKMIRIARLVTREY